MDCTPLLRENCNLYQAEVLKTRCCSVIHHTKSKVKLLKESEVIEEIARLASGENTPIALEHAKQLRAS